MTREFDVYHVLGSAGDDDLPRHSGPIEPGRVVAPRRPHLVRRTFAGLSVVVESPAGDVRYWVDAAGRRGATVMESDYGYLEGTLGDDGEPVDCYLGPREDWPWAYVVHQRDARSGFRHHDEDKVMLGFPGEEAAVAAYLRHVDDPRFVGGVSRIWVGELPRLYDPRGRPGRRAIEDDVRQVRAAAGTPGRLHALRR